MRRGLVAGRELIDVAADSDKRAHRRRKTLPRRKVDSRKAALRVNELVQLVIPIDPGLPLRSRVESSLLLRRRNCRHFDRPP